MRYTGTKLLKRQHCRGKAINEYDITLTGIRFLNSVQM